MLQLPRMLMLLWVFVLHLQQQRHLHLLPVLLLLMPNCVILMVQGWEALSGGDMRVLHFSGDDRSVPSCTHH
jgi:hypothetical protein